MRESKFQMTDVQTIELDCAPFSPRPGDFIDAVIEGTGLPKRDTVARLFGCWTWDYTDIPVDRWLEIRPTLKARICKLYEDGCIRYGSW